MKRVRVRWRCIVPMLGSVACGGLVAPGSDALHPDHARVLSRITGPRDPMGTCPSEFRIASANQTAERWQVAGTDLALAWDDGRDGGEIAIVFGDTYDEVDTTDPALEYRDHRRNVLGFSTDRTPQDGITVSRMLEDRPGHAGEILPATPGVAHEPSVIPTAGLAFAGRNYLFFMSVADWGRNFVWTTNFSSIAYSDDFAEHWTRSAAMWPANSKFAQVAAVLDGGEVFVLGTPSGRHGAMYLARVRPDRILEPERYEYYGEGAWHAGDETSAKPVVEAPLGELSIHRNASSGLWQLTYLNVEKLEIVLRTATSLTGPWSSETLLVDRRNALHTGAYGGFQHPWFNDGADLYLSVSRTEPCYSTFLMLVPGAAH